MNDEVRSGGTGILNRLLLIINEAEVSGALDNVIRYHSIC